MVAKQEKNVGGKGKNVGGKGIKKEKKIIMEFEDTRGF
jgi:hypothetical protein